MCFAHANEVRKANNTYKKIIIDRHYERGLLATADFLTNGFFLFFSALQKVTGAKVRKISE